MHTGSGRLGEPRPAPGGRRGRGAAAVVATLVALWSALIPLAVAGAQEGGSINRPPVLEKFGWWNRAQQLPPGGGEVPPPPGAPEHGIYVAQDVSSDPASSDEPPGGPSPTPTPPPGTPPLAPVPGTPLNPAPASTSGSPSSASPAQAAEPGSSPPARPEEAAIGAVRFSVPSGARALLTLQLDKGSAAGAGILACPIRSEWAPATNGRWDAKPVFNCSTSAKGRAQGREAVAFELPGSLQTQPGVFDLALVPRGSTPFEVAFKAPADSSLVVTLAVDSRPGAKEGFAASAVDDPGGPVRKPIPVIRDTRYTLSPAAAAALAADTSSGPVVPLTDFGRPPADDEEPRVLGVVRDLQSARQGGGPLLIAGGVVLLGLGSGLLWLARAARRPAAPA